MLPGTCSKVNVLGPLQHLRGLMRRRGSGNVPHGNRIVRIARVLSVLGHLCGNQPVSSVIEQMISTQNVTFSVLRAP
jgi:hypothetical protein